MKRLIVVSLFMVIMLSAVSVLVPARAQAPANDLKPTFISPTPGLYVNGWPAFTVSYPKEWMEMPPFPGARITFGVPRPDLPIGYYLPSLTIAAFLNPLPLEDWAKVFMPIWVEIATDIKVLSDKTSQLKDGNPAREVEFEGVYKNGPKISGLLLVTKKDKDQIWVALTLGDDKGKPVEDLKKIAYSLTLQPSREEPVQIPPDVRAFLDMFSADLAGRDVKTIMTHFSDRFLFSGESKAYFEQWLRNDPVSPMHAELISQEPNVTVFEPHGDKAYIDGFFLAKTKGDTNALKAPMGFQQIINEHGQWKWFGNQK